MEVTNPLNQSSVEESSKEEPAFPPPDETENVSSPNLSEIKQNQSDTKQQPGLVSMAEID